MLRGLEEYPVVLGVLGTLFTWFLTALGASVVFFVPDNLSRQVERKFLDASLGFSAGVMLAASFWSLLIPAIELSEEMMVNKSLAFLPPTIGFLAGCAVVFFSDVFLPDPDDVDELVKISSHDNKASLNGETAVNRNRIMLLIIAMTIHNFPEGLAVGVAFGSVGLTQSATLSKAILLTIGIGLQNLPEGLAVALPLHRSYKARLIERKRQDVKPNSEKSQFQLKVRAFFYGQLSGSVEIFGGFLGAYLVELSSLCLPYALGFAAGAMIFVVVDSIIPESHSQGNKHQATLGAITGFVTMMIMDVALG